MKLELTSRPGATAAQLILSPGETITSEAGSMISMSGDMLIETTTHKRDSGSILGGLKRMIAGESFFLNHYTAGQAGGEVYVAATLPGDMAELQLTDQPIIVQSGSFVASEQSVNVGLGWQGFKSMFSGEGMFWLNMTGPGRCVVNSFGSIYCLDVTEETIVDTGHIVAFDESLSFRISKAGKSWVSSILGGEGLVCRFSGQGRLWVQSHNATSFGRTLGGLLRPRR